VHCASILPQPPGPCYMQGPENTKKNKYKKNMKKNTRALT
jgi:hypothetical protein